MLFNTNLDIGTWVNITKYSNLLKNIWISSWYGVIFKFVREYFGHIIKEYFDDVMKYVNDIPCVHVHMLTFLFTYSPNNILACLTFVLNGDKSKKGALQTICLHWMFWEKKDVVNKDGVIIQWL